MKRNGRNRRKFIRAMAREGPVAAYRRWKARHERTEKMLTLNAPDVLIEHFRSLEHDAAEAVRQSKALMYSGVGIPRSEINLYVRGVLAEKGYEETPDSTAALAIETYRIIREALEKKGHPIPHDDDAMRELLRALGPRSPGGGGAG